MYLYSDIHHVDFDFEGLYIDLPIFVQFLPVLETNTKIKKEEEFIKYLHIDLLKSICNLYRIFFLT